eukprot:1158293-Pelagomonas_calceolata.AAC.15
MDWFGLWHQPPGLWREPQRIWFGLHQQQRICINNKALEIMPLLQPPLCALAQQSCVLPGGFPFLQTPCGRGLRQPQACRRMAILMPMLTLAVV